MPEAFENGDKISIMLWFFHERFQTFFSLHGMQKHTKKDAFSNESESMLTCENKNASAGSEINFFIQAPSGDWKFFFSRQMKKSGRQKAVCKIFVS